MEAIDVCLNGMDLRITSQMNIELQKESTRDEVEGALRHTAPLKSLGPNGYGACFYQAYWNIVGKKYVKLFWVL